MIYREENFDFSKHTTYGLGGLCKVAYFPETVQEAIEIFTGLKEEGEKFIILGNGSNILASERYFYGSVICTSHLKGIHRTAEDGLSVLSGTTVGELLNYCRKNGLSGLEFLAGIPASMGGLCYMNAGAGGKYISDVLKNCALFDGKLRDLSNKLCNFGYKYSTMRDINCLILSCTLTVSQTTECEVRKNMERYLSARSSHPKGRSCGCIFKNPDGLSAGKIIDECGLKGLKIGGASVSSEHANFIINNGATANEVYSLIRLVKQRVFEITGVCLDEEVVYIGEFNDTFS